MDRQTILGAYTKLNKDFNVNRPFPYLLSPVFGFSTIVYSYSPGNWMADKTIFLQKVVVSMKLYRNMSIVVHR